MDRRIDRRKEEEAQGKEREEGWREIKGREGGREEEHTSSIIFATRASFSEGCA